MAVGRAELGQLHQNRIVDAVGVVGQDPAAARGDAEAARRRRLDQLGPVPLRDRSTILTEQQSYAIASPLQRAASCHSRRSQLENCNAGKMAALTPR